MRFLVKRNQNRTKSVVGRIDEETKKQGERVLRHLGLTSSEYIFMCFRYLVNQQQLPFDGQKVELKKGN